MTNFRWACYSNINDLQYMRLFDKRSRPPLVVDVFFAATEYHKEALFRRKAIRFYGTRIDVMGPEDVILHKLVAGREKDMQDAEDVAQRQKRSLDLKYLRTWSKRFGVLSELEDVLGAR